MISILKRRSELPPEPDGSPFINKSPSFNNLLAKAQPPERADWAPFALFHW